MLLFGDSKIALKKGEGLVFSLKHKEHYFKHLSQFHMTFDDLIKTKLYLLV